MRDLSADVGGEDGEYLVTDARFYGSRRRRDHAGRFAAPKMGENRGRRRYLFVKPHPRLPRCATPGRSRRPAGPAVAAEVLGLSDRSDASDTSDTAQTFARRPAAPASPPCRFAREAPPRWLSPG